MSELSGPTKVARFRPRYAVREQIAKVMGQGACPVGRLYDPVNGIGKTTNTYLPWPGVIANHEFEPEQMQNALREQ